METVANGTETTAGIAYLGGGDLDGNGINICGRNR